jgi:hypothetical protein
MYSLVSGAFHVVAHLPGPVFIMPYDKEGFVGRQKRVAVLMRVNVRAVGDVVTFPLKEADRIIFEPQKVLTSVPTVIRSIE